jgi:hypothetical protein
MLGLVRRKNPTDNTELITTYGKIIGTRIGMIFLVYMLAIIVAYLIPAYTSNPYLAW